MSKEVSSYQWILFLSIACILVLIGEYVFLILDVRIMGNEIGISLKKANLTGWTSRLTCLGSLLLFGLLEAKRKVIINNKYKNTTFRISILTIWLIFSVGFIFLEYIPYLIVFQIFLYPIFGLGMIIATIYFTKTFGKSLEITENKVDISTKTSEKIDKQGAFFIPTVGGGGFPINNIFRSLIVSGNAGSGKSASWYHWFLFEGIQKEYSFLLYDFKRFDLTRYAYNIFKTFNITNLEFRVIDYIDMNRTNRCNPIRHDVLKNTAFAYEYMRCYMVNLNKDWIKNFDFWAKGVTSLATAVTLFLKSRYPHFCTIPHVNEFILQLNPKDMIEMLKTDLFAQPFAKGAEEAVFDKNSGGQVSGIYQNVRDGIAKMCIPEVYWVLTGDDFSLDLNNPDKPIFLALNSYAGLREILAPINSLIVSVASKRMLEPKENPNPSLILMDEGPTMFVPGIEETPEVGRSSKIGLIYGEQDLTQMDRIYGKEIRTSIMGAMANKAFGNTSELETIKYITDLFGTHEVVKKNVSAGNSDSSHSTNYSNNESYSNKEEKIIKNSEILNLKQGEFYCNLVENTNDTHGSMYKGRVMRPHDYHTQYKSKIDPNKSIFEFGEVPEFIKGVNDDVILQNFLQVKEDIQIIKEDFFNNK